MSGSLWKREISLRRKATEAAYPDPPVETAAAEVEADGAPPLPVASGDYGWLTESFDPNDVPDDMPAVVAPDVVVPARSVPIDAKVELAPVAVAAAPAKTPLWKKELSLKRAPKASQAAKEPKAPKATKATKAKTPKEPKAAKQPFWKKELSVRSKQAATDDLPKVAKPPIWKRELKFSKPKLARSAKTGTATEPTAKQPRQKAARNAGNGKSGVVGLKIGASQVAAARVSNDGGGPPPLGRIPALLPELFPDLSGWEVYTAGAPGFVDACADTARACGVRPGHLHTEPFFEEPKPWHGGGPAPLDPGSVSR